MKFTRSTIFQPFAMLALVASGAAFAGGDHAGGHGHDEGGETAIGKPGVAARVNRTIAIEMSDRMRFTPSDLAVEKGETVRFIVKNTGRLKHELSLGTQEELLEHLEQMRKFPDMEHDEPSKITLGPGRQGEIVWHFTKAGVVDFACLIPGHYEAGMKGTINVGRK
jgi:uncharacterized cupredoxin-like copper-binding protein